MSGTKRIVSFLVAGVIASGLGVVVASPASAATYTKCVAETHIYWGANDTHVRAPASSTYSRSCYLWSGDNNVAVGSLQKALRVCYQRTEVKVDNVFGPITKAALKAAQTSAGITPDGNYGPQSASMLRFPRYRGAFSDTEFAGCFRIV